jgi:hypothetical protein
MVGPAAWITAAALVAAAAAVFYRAIRAKNVDVIVRDRLTRRPSPVAGTRHVFFSVVDHFEPFWHNDDVARARERVQRWVEHYPGIAERHRDRGGNPPRHAFFYPQEEYPRDPACMEMLAGLARAGFGDVEVHLHHDADTAAALRETLTGFVHTLRERHGLLHDAPDGRGPAYAFIHGNWVLGNSHPRGRDCGVDDELVVLRETGCYADFTLPSAPHPSQPPVANRIYYPAGDPHRPRAHFQADEARYGVAARPGPLIVNGPLALNWHRRRRGLFPAIENGDLTGINPPSPDRTSLWVDSAVALPGFPRWIFVKVHTHGGQERNARRLLGPELGLDALFADLRTRFDDGERYVLHFSTPWEIYRAVCALEAADADAIRAIESFTYRF